MAQETKTTVLLGDNETLDFTVRRGTGYDMALEQRVKITVYNAAVEQHDEETAGELSFGIVRFAKYLCRGQRIDRAWYVDARSKPGVLYEAFDKFMREDAALHMAIDEAFDIVDRPLNDPALLPPSRVDDETLEKKAKSA